MAAEFVADVDRAFIVVAATAAAAFDAAMPFRKDLVPVLGLLYTRRARA